MNKDRKAVFEKEIAPLMGQLSDLCKKHDVPYVAAFQVDIGDDTELIHKSYLADPEDGDRLHMMIEILEHNDFKLEQIDTPFECVLN